MITLMKLLCAVAVVYIVVLIICVFLLDFLFDD